MFGCYLVAIYWQRHQGRDLAVSLTPSIRLKSSDRLYYCLSLITAVHLLIASSRLFSPVGHSVLFFAFRVNCNRCLLPSLQKSRSKIKHSANIDANIYRLSSIVLPQKHTEINAVFNLTQYYIWAKLILVKSFLMTTGVLLMKLPSRRDSVRGKLVSLSSNRAQSTTPSPCYFYTFDFWTASANMCNRAPSCRRYSRHLNCIQTFFN